MLNNKGQTLVLFVIFLPVLILLLILVIDIGKVIVLKQELSGICEIVLDYGIDKINEENIIDELNQLVILNKNDIDDFNLYIENEKIYINLEEKNNGIFSNFINISFFDIYISYVGYIENDEKRIERLGD